MSQLIQQQYYTRARHGIFRSTEGYDTIAKSDGLDPNFIKKTLHPFCTYDAPKELQKRGEKELGLYPESLVLFHGESGELILGRSVYVGADFTGQRNTFFTHNYVIPASRREELLQEPANIFGAQGFASRHDEADGKSLPGLKTLPKAVITASSSPKLALKQLGIDEKLFKQLLYAVMSSIASKKKVYVALNTDVSECSLQAKQLLAVLFQVLPYELRRHFGFLTFSAEPQSRKFINMMFVEKGSIRPGDTQIDKDFLFDFPNERFVNVELTQGEHEFLDFAWENLNQPHILKQFFDFAEEVLKGADRSISLRLTTYYQLAAFFLIEKGNDSLFQQNKAGVLHALIEYLDNQSLRGTRRLHDLFLGLFREENQALSPKNLPSVELVTCIIHYSRINQAAIVQKQIAQFLMSLLLKANEAKQSEYADEVYQQLLKNEELFGLIMNTIFQHEKAVKMLFEQYAAARIQKLGSVRGVLKEIAFWAGITEKAVSNRFWQESIQTKLIALFEQEQDKLGALQAIRQYLESFSQDRDFALQVVARADENFLKNVKLESLHREEFDRIISIVSSRPQVFLQQLDRKAHSKVGLLLHLHELLTNPDRIDHEDYFQQLTEQEAVALQRLLCNILGESLNQQTYLTLTFAFYQVGGSIASPFRFEEMLTFVHQQGGAERVFDFIRWSLTRQYFFTKRTLLAPYKQALKHYFVHLDPQALRDKQSRKMWFSIKQPELRKVLEEAMDESSGGMARFFRKYMDKLLIGAAAIVSVGTIGWAIYLVTGGPSPDTKPVPAVTDGQTVPGTPSGEDGQGGQNVPAQPVFGPPYPPGAPTDTVQPGQNQPSQDSPQGTGAGENSAQTRPTGSSTTPVTQANPTPPSDQQPLPQSSP